MVPELGELARGGRLRAAINTGNRALVQQDEHGGLTGVSPALARRLADEIGAELDTVVYDGAGKVFADAGNDAWDVGFLAVDAARAEQVGFTRPYVTIEATYAVRAESEMQNAEDADRPGRRILTSTGSAYDHHLSRTLRHATLERSGAPRDSFEEFRAGRADCVAGVRQTLEGFFDGDDAFRILPGAITRVEQAMVLPNRDHPLLPALDDFVRRAIDDGFVSREQAQG